MCLPASYYPFCLSLSAVQHTYGACHPAKSWLCCPMSFLHLLSFENNLWLLPDLLPYATVIHIFSSIIWSNSFQPQSVCSIIQSIYCYRPSASPFLLWRLSVTSSNLEEFCLFQTILSAFTGVHFRCYFCCSAYPTKSVIFMMSAYEIVKVSS